MDALRLHGALHRLALLDSAWNIFLYLLPSFFMVPDQQHSEHWVEHRFKVQLSSDVCSAAVGILHPSTVRGLMATAKAVRPSCLADPGLPQIVHRCSGKGMAFRRQFRTLALQVSAEEYNLARMNGKFMKAAKPVFSQQVRCSVCVRLCIRLQLSKPDCGGQQ